MDKKQDKMTARTLTAAQTETLRELVGFGANGYRMPRSQKTLWRVKDAMRTPQVDILIRLKYAEIVDMWTNGTARATITLAGREYLARLDGAK